MPRSRLLVVVACALVMACQPPTMTRSEALRYQQDLEGQVETWTRYMNNARVDSLLSMYDGSASLTVIRPDGSVTRGMEQEEEALRLFYGSIQYMNFVMQSPTTELLSADAAWTHFGHSMDVVGNDGRRRPVLAGRGTIVWLRSTADDVWKIHLLHLAANAPSRN
jgi:hypothetical protein